MLVIAFMPSFREFIKYEVENEVVLKKIPNIFCSIFGWFTIAFSTLHIYPPKMVTDKIRKSFIKV